MSKILVLNTAMEFGLVILIVRLPFCTLSIVQIIKPWKRESHLFKSAYILCEWGDEFWRDLGLTPCWQPLL